MADVKPIETRYKGYRFRSRLEARWAVFLDKLGVEWEYEPEGFSLEHMGAYLPDFFLPSTGWLKGDEFEGAYLEIKPGYRDAPWVEPFLKALDLSMQFKCKREVIVAFGLPPGLFVILCGHGLAMVAAPIFEGDELDFFPMAHLLPDPDKDPPFRFEHIQYDLEGKTFYGFELMKARGKNERIEGASIVAREARFEHGETPQV